MLYYMAFHMVLHCLSSTQLAVAVPQIAKILFYFNFNAVTLSENKQLFANFGWDN